MFFHLGTSKNLEILKLFHKMKIMNTSLYKPLPISCQFYVKNVFSSIFNFKICTAKEHVTSLIAP